MMIVTLLRPAVVSVFAAAVVITVIAIGTQRGDPTPSTAIEEISSPIPASSRLLLYAPQGDNMTGSPLGGWRR